MTTTRAFLASVLAGLLLLAATGCDDFLSINDDPNNPTEVPPSALLASTSFYTGQNVFDLGDITSNYVQYLASPNRSSASDIYERVSHDNTWGNLYDNMGDLTVLEEQAEEQGATDYVGIAKVLKALHLGLTVDMWGDVPYSEALDAETLNPSYDDDEALYDEVFALLSDGITALEADGSTAVPGQDDFIYGGDTDLWIKTAYALRARFLNHLTKTGQYDPGAVLAAVDNAYDSADENATVTYFEEEINPWADVAIDNAALLLGGWVSEQIVEALDGTSFDVPDPRIGFYMGTTDDDEYVGTENGAGRGDAPEQGARSVLTTDTYYAQRTGPLEIITYSELKFIEAEAALRDNQPGRAYDAYVEGITAHMDKLGVDPADRDAYLNDPAVDVGAGSLTLDDIFREKYKVMFLNPEAWVDARRYDYQYEDMTLPANSELSDFIRSIDYPDTERTRNGSNVPELDLLRRVWWDE